MGIFSVPSPAIFTRALITGASGGIGAALALGLSSRYSHLFLVGRRQDRLEELVGRIRGCKVTVLVGDLANPAFLQHIVSTVGLSEGLDLLVNNAGVGLFGGFDVQSDEEISNVIQVNLLAPMMLTKAMLPALRIRQSQVINVGSAFGAIGYPGFSAYSASKFGLRGWTEALSRELSDSSVRVRLFSPRATLTEMNDERVRKLNAGLNVAQDTPEAVVAQFMTFLNSRGARFQIGAPERFFAGLNALLPGVVGRALGRKLPEIRNYF